MIPREETLRRHRHDIGETETRYDLHVRLPASFARTACVKSKISTLLSIVVFVPERNADGEQYELL